MKHLFAILLISMTVIPSLAQAGWRHARWYGPGFYRGPWRHGYWFHGAYGGRAGWWWVVGPSWYYYPAPLYPYPPEGAQPVYVIQAANAPPPAGVPATGTPPTTGSPPPPTEPMKTPPPSEAKAFSYYCEKTKSYYPAAKDCADGWVATPVAPPK